MISNRFKVRDTPSLPSSSSSSSSLLSSKKTSTSTSHNIIYYRLQGLFLGIVIGLFGGQTIFKGGDGSSNNLVEFNRQIASTTAATAIGWKNLGAGEFNRQIAATTVSTATATAINRDEKTETEILTIRNRQTTGEAAAATTTVATTSTGEQHQDKEKDFLQIAKPTGTDKVAGHHYAPDCVLNRTKCTFPTNEREECRPWGHYYDSMYQQYLGKYSLPTTNANQHIQFLEIGYFQGKGFNAYTNYLNGGNYNNDGSGDSKQEQNQHELHSIEISCLEKGPQSEGKWPWGNFADKNPRYATLQQQDRLHCGDAAHYPTLKNIWETSMKRSNASNPAPPLMVVVDDGSHVAQQMTTSLFFWIPRLEPGGILIMEDIQPSGEANPFRTHILPQVIKDLHWCGETDPDKKTTKDTRCFPQLQPFLAGVHCEMHICVFIRNDKPSSEPNELDSMMPVDAMLNAQQCLFGPH